MLGLSKIKNDIARLQCEFHKRQCVVNDREDREKKLEKLEDSFNMSLCEMGEWVSNLEKTFSERIIYLEKLVKSLDGDVAELQKRKKPGRKPKNE